MGDIVECRARLGTQHSQGQAMLETDYVAFRGQFRAKVAFKDITGLQAEGGYLTLEGPHGTLTLDLGDKAAKWAHKIRNPKTVIEKLGIKLGHRVGICDLADASFVEQLREIGADVSSRSRRNSDLVFLGAETVDRLGKIASLIGCMRKSGAIWVVFPKGQKHIREIDVLNAGREAGLKDTKVVAFSSTHTALKFVLPLSAR